MEVFKNRVTIYEVAKASGVSLATVSRVINNQPNVTEETRKKVQDTIARLGYKPNALAQGLATNRTTNIGIVIPDVNYVHISNLLSGMIDIGKIYGYQTTLFITKNNEQDTKEVIARLITSHVDGAIVFDDEIDENGIKNITDINIPTVFIGRDVEGEKVGSIILDYVATLKDVIKHHVERDGRRVTFVKTAHEGHLIESIEKAIKKELPEDKVNSITITDSYHETYSLFVDYFKKYKKAYLVSPRDSLACAISNAALDMGVDVPDDVEVVSIIGTKYSFLARPTISSCELDLYEVGSIAMRMVTKLLKDELKDRSYRFEARYTSRGSTKD